MRAPSIAVLLLLAAAARAGPDSAVSVRAEDARFEDVAQDIAKQAGLEVEVAEELRDRTLTLFLEDISARDALTILAALCEGKLVESEDESFRFEIVPPEPDWLRRLKTTLQGTWVSVGFGELPLEEAVAKLAASAGLTIALDPAAPKAETSSST